MGIKGLLVTIGLLSALGVAVHAQPPTFKTSIELVPISAVVRDGRGRLVTKLTAADFEVLDRGQRRRIVDFQIDAATPVTVAVVVDVSGSMRMGASMLLAGAVVKHLTTGLRDGHDEVGLFTFDAALHEQQPFTRSMTEVDGVLAAVRPFGSTSLYDAIAETARRLERRPSPRRAIVVLTDGVDTSSALTPFEVSAIANAIDVPVYVVATVGRIDQESYRLRTPGAGADLPELARWTGGELLWVTAPLEAATSARTILDELRHQYLIAIEAASHDGEWRTLDVRTRNRKLTVRTRSGYSG